ncbi:MAG: phosphatidate cytidylyltransferase [Enterovirga sp.]|nr:phosphatidate cytidylyltransferase [Enterovirga sp.]
MSPLRGDGQGPWIARTCSELELRVGSAFVLAAAALTATWAGGALFTTLLLAAALAMAAEWLLMVRAEPRLLLIGTASIGLLALTAARNSDVGPLVSTALAVGIALLLAGLARGMEVRLWAAAGFAYAAIVAIVPPIVRDDPALGLVAVLWMFAVVWGTDIAAYFAGRRFGGPKLWPSVSPKKTWSGFIAGVGAAVLAGCLVITLAARLGASHSFDLATTAAASALGSLASQIGDLAESAMKRHFGVKDSGRLIPGHGGVMDRLDGFVALALLMGLALAGLRLAAR